MATGSRRRPQLPGAASKTPAQAAPQLAQRPSGVRPQAVSRCQSRPISVAPQPAVARAEVALDAPVCQDVPVAARNAFQCLSLVHRLLA